jgi:hypothetical protein
MKDCRASDSHFVSFFACLKISKSESEYKYSGFIIVSFSGASCSGISELL